MFIQYYHSIKKNIPKKIKTWKITRIFLTNKWDADADYTVKGELQENHLVDVKLQRGVSTVCKYTLSERYSHFLYMTG